MENLSQGENRNVTNEKDTQVKKSGFWSEIIKFTVIAVIVVVPFRMFIAQPFIVSGASMYPTFKDGEYLIVDQLSFHLEKPKRDSVIIFKYPKDTSTFFIKRVIGLPGETVQIKSGIVTIKNTENPNGFILSDPFVAESNKKYDDYGPKTLGEKEYFVLGDNRLGSLDSRSWGNVPENLIVGRPLLRVLPFNKVGVFPGNYNE